MTNTKLSFQNEDETQIIDEVQQSLRPLTPVNPQTETQHVQASSSKKKTNLETENEKVLCPHCERTAINGIKCKGLCVADSDY